jgi:Golgi SNAP receptor complex protein 1
MQMDDAMGQAQAVASSLADQRQMFDNIGSKLMTIGNKFPIVNGLLNAIRRKKNRVQSMTTICDYFMLWLGSAPTSVTNVSAA